MLIAFAWPLILGGAQHGRGALDERDFHLPAIRTFADQWPHFDFSDYLSATTPGYHVVLATIDRWIANDRRVLELFGSLFTLGFLATLGIAAARRLDVFASVICCLPVIASLYIFSAGVWLLPDNAAWWGILAVILIALRRPVDAGTFIAGGAVLLALVLVRQSGLWTAAPLCAAAWLGDGDTAFSFDSKRATFPERFGRLVRMGLAILPSIAVLLMFFHLWHGTVPPRFQHATFNSPPVSGANPATPAAVLAEVGVVAFFFIGMLLPRFSELARQNR